MAAILPMLSSLSVRLNSRLTAGVESSILEIFQQPLMRLKQQWAVD